MAVDAALDRLLGPVTEVFFGLVFHSVDVGSVSLPLVVVWLSVASIFFTAYFGLINLRGFSHALRLVRGDFADPGHKGEVSHFGALTAALSGTVGVGNVAGVALAITMGGPGAAFWMVVAGFCGMSLKFAECALSVKYRRINPDGTVSGGPMYYLKEGLARRGWPRLGWAAAAFFAVMMVLGSFNPFQVNQAFVQFSLVTGFDHGFLFGLGMAFVLGLVIIGGIRSIARVTTRLVPVMCGIYVVAGLALLVACADQLPGVFALILADAFALDSVAGGVLGSLIIGFQRAAYSSEAGLGSAAIAHSAVRTAEPVTEGFVALLEPFLDTVVVCTITALVIVVTGMYRTDGIGGVEITSGAFATIFPWFPSVLSITIMFLAMSTVLAWAYYGERAWGFLFGESKASRWTYKVLLLCGISVGATLEPVEAIRFMDAAVFAMAVPNILALYLFASELKSDLKSYRARVASGQIVNHRLRRRAAAVVVADG